ncbi:hypothetical protein [Salinibacterium sp.]|uniref:hypothetical protein n=1 Tax=Salinibacterium sp. TaxID=1915057 RepID=UPI00286CE3F8|nr:hypothetical protein [Salinibacterium sp.]
MDVDEENLAELWWQFHGRGGVLGTSNPIDDEQADQLRAVDDWVLAKSESVQSLTRLLELLAQSAPNEDELPYIGTWVLEDADMDHAASPKDALAGANLSQSVIDAIQSGYLPWRDLQ